MKNRIKDLSNMRFGKLTVLFLDEERTEQDKGKLAFWICKCDCGNIKSIRGCALTAGNTRTCGNCPPDDLTQQKFGRLTPIEWYRKDKIIVWKCRCDCGNIVEVYQQNLLQGKSQSCGCLQKELASKRFGKHFMRNTKLLDCYYNMKSRCYDASNKRYNCYGGRGITVCDEWKNSSTAFVEWALSAGYVEGLTIDRIDVNGNYEPSNCRWITKKEQSYNTRKSIIIDIDGQKKCLKEWTTLMQWKYGTYSARYRRGVPIFTETELQQIQQKLKENKNE